MQLANAVAVSTLPLIRSVGTMELRDEILELVRDNPSVESVVIAEKILSRHAMTRKLQDYFLPAVSTYVSVIRSNDRKATEKLAFGAPTEIPAVDFDLNERYAKYQSVEVHTLNDPRSARNLLLTKSFYVPGKGRVTWGEATIEDHQAYIAHLHERIAGTQLTISRHEKAITILRINNARCLNDVEDLEDLQD